MSSEFPEVDLRARAESSELPEVVQPSYPEAYGYIRPRNEPGETEAKILAYDQAGKEVKSDIVSPLAPEATHGQDDGSPSPLEEPPSEKSPLEKSRHTLRGCTPWRLLVLAVIVILAAVGGGVGGGIAASRSQAASTPVTTTR